MKPKKKSTSHVTELKKRVKAKILGKAEGPSSTSQTKIPQGTDVSPAEIGGIGTSIYPEGDVRHEFVPPTLAQNVLSRLTSKCPSSPSAIPKGTLIK